MHEHYDIINQLGPRNRFDRLAGEAVLAGNKYHDPELGELGAQLAYLIKTIRYDSDKYFLIVGKAQDIEDRIKAHTSLTKEEVFNSPGGNRFDITIDPPGASLQIKVGCYRATVDTSGDPLMNELKEKLLSLLESKGTIGKSFDKDPKFTLETWKDSEGQVVFFCLKWTHITSAAVGLGQTFTFYDKVMAGKAQEIWREVIDKAKS